ncbi:MAG: UMP kinase [Candidatus Helarchaeota archaeon]|nr:UMP kinase [Candidatus Helarchaeota archaeon]
MRIVIKVGGSLIQDTNGEIRINYLKELVNILRKIKENNEIALIVGGGKSAHSYIRTARELGAPEALSDEIGIEIAKIHARLLITALDELAYPKTFDSLSDAVSAFESGKIIVLGGLQPGQSTNAVASLLAERLKANLLINATDVSGVYTADPKQDPSAKKLDVLNISDFGKYINFEKSKAGEYSLFDYVAYLIIKRSKIPFFFISGEDPKNIIKIINGEKIGTKIVYD